MIRVLVVDDHGIVRSGIKMILQKSNKIEVVAEADSGRNAIKVCSEMRDGIDVVLMDLQMEDMDGATATSRLLRAYPDMKIIIITVCDNDIYPTKLLQMGAHGFVTKSAPPEEMLRAIMVVNTGQRYISPEIASKLAIKHLTDTGESPFEMLSERELQVTLMVVKGTDVKDIANKLCLSTKTVNSYRYRIFEKLSVKNDVELTLLAIRHGLVEDVNG